MICRNPFVQISTRTKLEYPHISRDSGSYLMVVWIFYFRRNERWKK